MATATRRSSRFLVRQGEPNVLRVGAPTETEIREAIRLRVELYPADNPREKLNDAIDGFAAFLSGPAYEALKSPDPRDPSAAGRPDQIWTDLRPSEAADLDTIFRETVEALTHDLEVTITAQLTAAALRFARLYPDAPRAVVNLE